MLFWIWLRPQYKIPEFFYDSTCPHLHFDGLPPIRRLYISRVRYKYYRKNSRFGLAWSRPRADRGLSRPHSVQQ